MVCMEKAHENYDFIMIAIIAIAVTMAFSEKTLDYKLFRNKVVDYLEKLSLPIYLNHTWIIGLGKNLMPVENAITKNYYKYFAVIVVATILISIIEMTIINTIKNKGLMDKLKVLFVKK